MSRACIELPKHKTAKKTGKIRRIMLHAVALKLVSWIARHAPHERFIFVNAKRRQWERTAICWRLRTIREKAGVSEETTLYGLRHRLLTEAVLSGVDSATVMAIAGHERISTTQTYFHVSGKTDHLRAAMEQIFKRKA